IQNRVVYKYIGEGQGDYTSQSEVPAPKRLTTGELVGTLNLNMLQATIDIAGQAYDKNLQSSKDDDDNLSSSAVVTLSGGKKRFDKPSVWVNGNYKFISRNFDRDNINRYEQLQQWDDSAKVETNREVQVWDAVAGFTPVKGVSAEVSYGQNRDSLLVTDRISTGCRLQPGDRLLLQYNNTIFNHHRFEIRRRNRNELSLGFTGKKQRAEVILQEEWAYDTGGTGAGEIGTILNYELRPVNLMEKLTFVQHRTGDGGILSSVDTGYTVTWEQSIDHQIFPWWRVNGSTSYLYSMSKSLLSDNDQRSSTLLMNVQSEINPSRGFESRVQYTLSSEKRSDFIQVPIYAGKGLGTHVYVDSEYVPSVNGDWYIQQKEVYDTTGLSIRKACLDLNWKADPQKKLKGILNDLVWSGTLRLDEHVDNRIAMKRSWLPGLVTIKNYSSKTKNEYLSSYADLSYRQGIEWVPEEFKNWSGNLSGTVFLKKIRSYQEPGFEGFLQIDAQKKKFFSVNELHYSYLFHDDSLMQDYYIRDVYTMSTQRYSLNKSIEFYLKECLGWARQDDPERYHQKLSLDSCLYAQIHPGVLFKIKDRGRIDGSYEMSLVTIPGETDYRIARGFASGLTHVLGLTVDIQIGSHISIVGSYRGEFHRLLGVKDYRKSEHVANIEMKAFL
ncbi:MAG: hypothetical protein GX640_18830, partial [Fibrobacter sp.]|nr:hypothetical protein [Fibrobacter sp.]